ncbi:MAG: diguanylate cyclase [Pseudomonas monteilii]|nr:MAG: diguanylate cyclase [Pseudomonas monteilii]
MGAGVRANTGEARAIHCAACFAGRPAPTGAAQGPGPHPYQKS